MNKNNTTQKQKATNIIKKNRTEHGNQSPKMKIMKNEIMKTMITWLNVINIKNRYIMIVSAYHVIWYAV